MLRLPPFQLHRPRTLGEACDLLAAEGAAEGNPVRVVAGGTDLWPNLKRRQERAETVISLMGIGALRGVAAWSEEDAGGCGLAPGAGTAGGAGARNRLGLRVGATTTLDRVAASDAVVARYPALAAAAAGVSTAALRNMGTIGGNLCLNTRCTYFGQSEDWRCSIDWCMKEQGEVCWVAPSSDRCWAISSSDTAPVLAALGARVVLASTRGERTLPVAQLYRDDGIDWLEKDPDEILVEVLLPASSAVGDGGSGAADGRRLRTAYRKLRRRGSIDFAALTVAAAVWCDRDGRVERASLWLGSMASSPLRVPAAERLLEGSSLDHDTIAAAARASRAVATPLDNADFTAQWRSRMVEVWVAETLRACA